MQLHVDDREVLLWEMLREKRAIDIGGKEKTIPLRVERVRLQVGDADLTYNEKRVVVFERKRADDLLASVADGRLARQWASHDEECLYIPVIEEMGDTAQRRIDKRAKHIRGGDHDFMRTWIQLALQAVSTKSNTMVVRTASAVETTQVILLVAVLVYKRITNENYVPTCLKDRVTSGTTARRGAPLFVKQLCCIDGISEIRAKRLCDMLAKHGIGQTMAGLLRLCAQDDGQGLLNETLGPALGKRLASQMMTDSEYSKPATPHCTPATPSPSHTGTTPHN